MKFEKKDWESIKKQAEGMIKEANLTLMSAELMFNKASMELNDFERNEEILK